MAAVGSRHFRLLTRLWDRVGGDCSCFSGVTTKPGKEHADARVRETVDAVLNSIPDDAAVTRKMIEIKYQEKIGAFTSVTDRSRVLHTFHILYKDSLFKSSNGKQSQAEKGRKPRQGKKNKRGDSEVKTKRSRIDAPQSSEDKESDLCVLS